MTADFQGWTPPPGEVVAPPVHPETKVLFMWSDGVRDDQPRLAGSQNWSGEGDGPRVVAYAVVEEYKPEPREWWTFGQIMKDSLADAEAFRAECERVQPDCGMIDIPIIHVRQVLPPADDPECTDCGGTGVRYQTERPCTCDAGREVLPAAHEVVAPDEGWSDWRTDISEWNVTTHDVRFECIGGIHKISTRPRSEALPAAREVVAWAVVRDGQIIDGPYRLKEIAEKWQARWGGTVRPLGFLP